MSHCSCLIDWPLAWPREHHNHQNHHFQQDNCKKNPVLFIVLCWRQANDRLIAQPQIVRTTLFIQNTHGSINQWQTHHLLFKKWAGSPQYSLTLWPVWLNLAELRKVSFILISCLRTTLSPHPVFSLQTTCPFQMLRPLRTSTFRCFVHQGHQSSFPQPEIHQLSRASQHTKLSLPC